ncbi:hypothetical protein [Bacillus paralicheniformis]|nr:hypothetical protein [Bacillus paralicheniformis]MEC1101652.1 hypothetical protein [Bacillus paralicheniformis]
MALTMLFAVLKGLGKMLKNVKSDHCEPRRYSGTADAEERQANSKRNQL